MSEEYKKRNLSAFFSKTMYSDAFQVRKTEQMMVQQQKLNEQSSRNIPGSRKHALLLRE